MNSYLKDLIIYSLSIIIIAWIGGLIPFYLKHKQRMIHLFISLGAGVLLGASFLHMIPDAIKYIGPQVGIAALLGFLTLYLLEKFIMTHPCPAEHCEYHKIGLSAFIGLSLHSLITGLALGAGIMVPRLGIIVFIAILFHKLPASLSLTSLFIKENYSNKKLFTYLTAFSVMVPLGAFITYFVFEGTASHTTIGYLIAFSAGTFLHVAADDLLPEVHHHATDRITRLIVFLLGLVIIWGVKFLE